MFEFKILAVRATDAGTYFDFADLTTGQDHLNWRLLYSKRYDRHFVAAPDMPGSTKRYTMVSDYGKSETGRKWNAALTKAALAAKHQPTPEEWETRTAKPNNFAEWCRVNGIADPDNDDIGRYQREVFP